MTPEEAIRVLQGMQQQAGEASMTHLPPAPTPMGPLETTTRRVGDVAPGMWNRLLGANGQERMQLWPERAVRAFGRALTDPLPEAYDRDAYVQRAADLNLLPTGASAFMRPQAGQLGVFAGAGARTADRAALERATEMHLGGTGRGETLENTGWFLSPGQPGPHWMWEIPDNKSRLMPAARERIAQSKPAPGRQLFLPDIMEHPELFRAYPQLAETKVWPSENQNYGYSHVGAISLPTKYLPQKVLRDLALHEIDHEVQAMEGFPQGASPHYVMFGKDTPQWQIMMNQLSKGGNPEKTFNRMNPGGRLGARQDAAEEFYRRSAGEAMANATQRRADMTPEQRRAFPNYPWVDAQRHAGPERDWIIQYLEGGQR